MVLLGKGGKADKQDSKESKSTDDKGKTGKTAPEQEEKPPPLPSAYDEDLKLRAAMYGVLFQAYADKVSHWPCQLYCGTRLLRVLNLPNNSTFTRSTRELNRQVESLAV